MAEDANSRPTQSRQGSRPGGDSAYLAVAAGLLVLIIALLASLWLRERAQRLAVERELIEYRHRATQLDEALRHFVLESLVEEPEDPPSEPVEE